MSGFYARERHLDRKFAESPEDKNKYGEPRVKAPDEIGFCYKCRGPVKKGSNWELRPVDGASRLYHPEKQCIWESRSK